MKNNIKLSTIGYADIKYPEWMVALSEWKVETGHHIIGPRYAKQFAKTLS